MTGRNPTDHDGPPVEAVDVEAAPDPAAELLGACAARGDLAARWFLRARARGEGGPSEEHARRVAELEAGSRSVTFEHGAARELDVAP